MSFSSSTPRLFISCGGSLEPFLMEELLELGIRDVEKGFRGVLVPKTMDAVYRINYGSRIATRVLWPLLEFPCEGRRSLYQAVSSIDWGLYLKPDQTFAIDANLGLPSKGNVEGDALNNSHFAALVVKDAICDQQRARFHARSSVDVKFPHVQLNLFIHKGMGILYYDTSLQPLYKRGYRIESGEAPLQESLAAAILRKVGYNQQAILCDPFAGSGTFLMEAAMMATRTPPGIFRKVWGFERMRDYSKEAWGAVKTLLDAQKIPLQSGKIFGADEDRSMVGITSELLDRAGFGKEIPMYPRSILQFHPTVKPTLVVGNPPYGRRLSRNAGLEKEISLFLERERIHNAYFLFPDDKKIDMPHHKELSCLNGGLGVHLIRPIHIRNV